MSNAENKLKRLSAAELEKVICEALRQAIGEKYEATVHDIEYDVKIGGERKEAKVIFTLTDPDKYLKF